MPIALDTIEERLRRHEFDTLEQLESYFKRMIANAKDYNQRGSEVYDDSERLRKALSNVMVKINPAYQNPGYSAYPTPLPSDSKSGSKSVSKPTPKPAPKVTLKVSAPPPPIVDEDAEGELDDEDQTPIKRGRGRPPKDPRALQTKSATPSEYRYSGVGFEALSFQQAQEKILEDLITRKDNPEYVISFLHCVLLSTNVTKVMKLPHLKYSLISQTKSCIQTITSSSRTSSASNLSNRKLKDLLGIKMRQRSPNSSRGGLLNMR